MFYDAAAFNQDIGDWDVSSVTDMNNMFDNAMDFNQNIGNWNVSNVTNMSGMFWEADNFNHNIGNWNVSSVKDMSWMFSNAKIFNQNIGNWNVSNVTDMNGMFWQSYTFNQDIGSWDVSSVTNMPDMFFNTSAFNQNLGKWNLSRSKNMKEMLDYCGMDCINYSATVRGWSENPITPDSIILGANGIQYGSSAMNARNNLITTKGWTINGDIATGTKCDLITNVIEDDIEFSKLKVYPNPVTNELTIEIEGNSKKTGFDIINALGQSVYKGKMVNQATVQTGDFAPGTYFIKFDNGKTFDFTKVSKK